MSSWKLIPGYERYEVSDAGGVRNRARGNVLKAWTHRSGHLYVSLGRGHKRQVHRLVLQAHTGPVPEGMECCHIDGDPTNNNVANLRWATRAENIDDLKRTSGRYARAGLSDEAAGRVLALYRGRVGDQTRIARELGISLYTVSRIIRGRTYAHLWS